MKKIQYVLWILLVMACGSSKIKETNPMEILTGPKGVKGSIEEPVGTTYEGTTDNIAKTGSPAVSNVALSSVSEMERVVGFLASDELEGRDSGSEGIAKAAHFIETYFKQHSVIPYFEFYRDTLTNFNPMAYNVVGWLEGNDAELKNEFIVIGAHYDHIGIIAPVNGDAIANGANDNASGTAMVLELARYFGTSKSNKRSLMFVLFTAEEKGLLGSEHLAKKLNAKGFNLYLMLNFEMMGVPMVGKNYDVYLTGYQRSNLAGICNTYAGENLVGFLPKAKEYGLFQRSDNYPFHKAFNVPSQTFCTFDFTNFDHYHKVGDEVELLDYGHMVRMVNRLIPVVQGIANAPEKEIRYN